MLLGTVTDIIDCVGKAQRMQSKNTTQRLAAAQNRHQSQEEANESP